MRASGRDATGVEAQHYGASYISELSPQLLSTHNYRLTLHRSSVRPEGFILYTVYVLCYTLHAILDTQYFIQKYVCDPKPSTPDCRDLTDEDDPRQETCCSFGDDALLLGLAIDDLCSVVQDLESIKYNKL